MLDENDLEFLKTLVFNDLKLNYTGESIESLMNCGNINFNIPKEDVKFKRHLLSKLVTMIMNNANQTKLNSMQQLVDGEIAIRAAKRLSAAQINTISTSIIEQKKLEAIKKFRQATGLGLKDAKQFMDCFIPNNPLPSNFSYIIAANKFSDICV